MQQPHPFARWIEAHSASRRGALVFGETVWTWSELADLVDRSAGGLRRSGVVPGDRVGLWASPTLETVTALLALARIGAASVPFDPRTPDREVDDRVAGADIHHFLATMRWPERTQPIEPDHLLASTDRFDGDLQEQQDREVSIVFTSGSRGEARGVILTAGNVEAAVAASRARLGTDEEDRWLLVLPLWHVGGLSIVWRSLASGGSIAVHDRFDPAAVASELRGGDVSVVSLVPTMLQRLLDVDPGPFPPLRAVLLGGAAAAPQLVERGLDAGLPILATYGMTEACSQIATVVPGDERASVGTVGVPLDGVEVELRAADTDETSADCEIIVRGPTVSPGYVGEMPGGGALATGDTGYLDESGRLVVTGRVDDLIITGGENVQPLMVERVLEAHPFVAAAAVYGVPDDEWGQVVAAAIVPAGRRPSPGELSDYLSTRLTPYQIPKRWRIVDALPLLANGKVNRRAIASGR